MRLVSVSPRLFAVYARIGAREELLGVFSTYDEIQELWDAWKGWGEHHDR